MRLRANELGGREQAIRYNDRVIERLRVLLGGFGCWQCRGECARNEDLGGSRISYGGTQTAAKNGGGGGTADDAVAA